MRLAPNSFWLSTRRSMHCISESTLTTLCCPSASTRSCTRSSRYGSKPWAARYMTRLLIESTPIGVVFPFLCFLSISAKLCACLLIHCHPVTCTEPYCSSVLHTQPAWCQRCKIACCCKDGLFAWSSFCVSTWSMYTALVAYKDASNSHKINCAELG